MNMDGILLEKYALELKKILPAKINKIQQISDLEFLFQLRSNSQNHSLFLSLQPKAYRFNLTNKKFTTSFDPSNFLMVLRKHLNQGILIDAYANQGDRVVTFEIETLNNLRDKTTVYLHLEFFGKYTNIILVNKENKIIDCLKKTSLISERVLYPQSNFEPAFTSNKHSIFANNHLEINDYNGISLIIKQELENNPAMSIAQLQKKLIDSNEIYFYPNTNKFHLIPLTTVSEDATILPINEALDIIYGQDSSTKRIDEVTGNIHHYVKKELEKSQRKLLKLKASLNDAQNLEKYKNYGDLLYSFSYQLLDHTKEAVIVDFEGNTQKIPLDEKYDIKENAKRYYKKYTKAKTALIMVQQQIDKTQESIQYYQEIQEQLRFIQLDDALEIAEELKLSTKKQAKTAKKKQPNFITLEIDNVRIFIGKNNIQNDYITNKISKKHYLWFHVKDFHGSHVVINQSEVNEKILRLAASFAAYFSQARNSSSIPVNYCLLKQLKATRGNHLGMVYLGSYKTIYIDINEQELLSIIEKYRIES